MSVNSIGRLMVFSTYFGGSKPPPYKYFFCNRKRTVLFSYTLAPLRYLQEKACL